MKLCKKMGVALLNAADDTFYTDASPEGVFKRQIMGAMDEFSYKKVCSNMRDGRERKRATSKKLTLTNKRKVEGRCSFLDLHPRFVQIVQSFLVRPFANLVGRNGNHWKARDVSTKLFQRGVRTQVRGTRSGGEKTGDTEVNSGVVVRWLKHCDTAGL